MDFSSIEKRYPLLISSLKNARKAGRLAHAYLVVSSNPDFRDEFPIFLGRLAACRTPLEDGAPCGKCESCRQLEARTYTELFELFPASRSRQIRVGDDDSEPNTLRWFEKQLQLSSVTASGWKIGVIHDADRLNENAQNAFLKTLEEPHPRCLLTLSTGRPSELLPTIRSRCQALHLTDNKCVYKFPRCADLPELLHQLQFEAKGDILKASDAAESIIGVMGALKEAADEEVDAKWGPLIEKFKSQMESDAFGRWNEQTEETVAAEKSARYRDMREQFVSMTHAWFAQVMLLAEGAPEEAIPNPEIMEPLKRGGRKPEPEAARKALAKAEELLTALRTNVNDDLAMRAFCLGVALKN